jgi:hypothetical protein
MRKRMERQFSNVRREMVGHLVPGEGPIDCPHCRPGSIPGSRSDWADGSGGYLQAPSGDLAKRDGQDPNDTAPSSWNWIELPWQVETPDGLLYVAEAYKYPAEAAMADLAYLEDNGWQTAVHDAGLHFPGTCSVRIARPGVSLSYLEDD